MDPKHSQIEHSGQFIFLIEMQLQSLLSLVLSKAQRTKFRGSQLQ